MIPNGSPTYILVFSSGHFFVSALFHILLFMSLWTEGVLNYIAGWNIRTEKYQLNINNYFYQQFQKLCLFLMKRKKDFV